MNLAILLLLLAEAVAFGPGGRFQLEQRKDDFGERSHGIVETLPTGGTKLYPLPQSTFADYMRLRAEDARINPVTADHYDRQEVIGPYQIEGDKIWFGNNYYDSEGSHGVGAFGYFDTASRQYTLFSPPEVARYEVSAILADPQQVWLGLDRFIEDISTEPEGLVRWDRTTHAAQFYPLEFAISKIRREGESLRLETRYGYALFKDGKTRRFLSNGIPVATFPPPPTHF
ncbi:MAG TPA: hypothetical protein VFW44_00715 [Bryobacteraceae bacterium]|nr:hypothetical protein [Bryobacteraceae bacterium]